MRWFLGMALFPQPAPDCWNWSDNWHHEILLARTTKCGLKKFQCRAVACAYIENNLSKTNNLLIELKHQRRRTKKRNLSIPFRFIYFLVVLFRVFQPRLLHFQFAAVDFPVRPVRNFYNPFLPVPPARHLYLNRQPHAD